jgi:hypothetical protein
MTTGSSTVKDEMKKLPLEFEAPRFLLRGIERQQCEALLPLKQRNLTGRYGRLLDLRKINATGSASTIAAVSYQLAKRLKSAHNSRS